jgi:mRNA interferase YafQ
MRTPVYTRQFDRDLKRMKKRRKKIEKLKIVLRSLIEEEELDPIHQDHKLIGNWLSRRECHIESDWLLIYKKEDGRIIFERTGSHSDLFNK